MKKSLSLWIIAVLCTGLVVGCSGNETEAEEIPEEETVQEIGDPSASLEVDMTNDLGGTISGLSVKKPEMLIYPDNIMTEDQHIENEETVKFYYDPEDASSEEVNVKPDHNYMGYWNQAGSTDIELTIWDISDNTVTFHIWWDRLEVTGDTTVTLGEDNVGTFSTMINSDCTVEGTISFTYTSVKIIIDHCDYDDLDIGPFDFDEKHPESWEYDEDYSFKEGDTEQQASDSIQVTMADNTVYELSDFAMDDMKDVTLCYEDEVAFLEYTKSSTNETFNTKEQEQTIKQDKEAAQAVNDQITLIGTVTLDSEEDVTAAREAYDALTDIQKTYVYNEPLLMWKELTLRSLIYENEGPTKIADMEEDEEEYDEDYTEGDNWAWGYNLAMSGMSEEEAAAEWNKYDDPEQDGKYYDQYYNDFWEGFWAGYGDYTPAGQDETRGDRNRIIANGGSDPWEDDEVYDDWDDEAMDWD